MGDEVWSGFEILLRTHIHGLMTLSADPQAILGQNDILVGPIIPSFARMLVDQDGKFSYDANYLARSFSPNFVVKHVNGGYFMRLLSLSGEFIPSQWAFSVSVIPHILPTNKLYYILK